MVIAHRYLLTELSLVWVNRSCAGGLGLHPSIRRLGKWSAESRERLFGLLGVEHGEVRIKGKGLSEQTAGVISTAIGFGDHPGMEELEGVFGT